MHKQITGTYKTLDIVKNKSYSKKIKKNVTFNIKWHQKLSGGPKFAAMTVLFFWHNIYLAINERKSVDKKN